MSLVKAENLKKRALRFLHNDYTSLYELSLKNSRKPKISFANIALRFPKLNNINPSFVKKIFKLTMTSHPTQKKYKLNLEIPKSNQLRFGTESLRYLVQKFETLYYI